MWVYTFDEDIKNKLLDNKAVLNTQREIDGKLIYVFMINDMSILYKFSKEENSNIYPCNNKMFF